MYSTAYSIILLFFPPSYQIPSEFHIYVYLPYVYKLLQGQAALQEFVVYIFF